MTPLKPYLIRSIYEWIEDNEMTPHLLADAKHEGIIVPEEHITNGEILLNIRPSAIQGLVLGNDEIEFNARFSGKPMHLVIPITAVLAIFAKETGRGMFFDPEDNEDPIPPIPPKPADEKKSPQKPKLSIVK